MRKERQMRKTKKRKIPEKRHNKCCEVSKIIFKIRGN
jgi:hypothetical protein